MTWRPDSEPGKPDPGSGIPEPGPLMSDPGSMIRNLGCRIEAGSNDRAAAGRQISADPSVGRRFSGPFGRAGDVFRRRPPTARFLADGRRVGRSAARSVGRSGGRSAGRSDGTVRALCVFCIIFYYYFLNIYNNYIY